MSAPAPTALPEASSSSPRTGSHLTFTQGFILGQASFLLIVLLFMRYVVFSPADKGDEEGWRRKRSEREKVSRVAMGLWDKAFRDGGQGAG